MGLFSKIFGKDKKKNASEAPEAVAVQEQQAAKTQAEEACENTAADNKKLNATARKPKEEPSVETQAEAQDDEAADEIATDENSENLEAKGTSGIFDIKKSRDGRYVFNLYARNKVIIATSQIYSSAQSAINGIKSVIANAERAGIEDQTQKNFESVPFPKWEIYKDKGGQFRFRLCAPNGSCICHSQGYTAKASCKNGIESIIRTVKDAKIDKSYLTK